jgi:hypothetical protein
MPAPHVSIGVCVQPPAAQPSTVHPTWSSQSIGAPGAHVPPPHASPTVHPLPSEQADPLFTCTQPWIASHASSVHGFASSHIGALPPVHAPLASHASSIVHAS